MPVADILRLGLANMSPQQIADMALEEDRAAREAARRGDTDAARLHDMESAKLCALLEDK